MKKTIAIVTLMLCAVATAMAQHTVSGTVTDLNGEPLAGVAVMVQDSPSRNDDGSRWHLESFGLSGCRTGILIFGIPPGDCQCQRQGGY